MKNNKVFFQAVCNLAIPVALQSMLQASFSIIDQIMIGQLGSVSVAGVGLGGKFSSVFTVLVSAIGAVAGIMISQYMGQKNKQEVRRSFFVNLFIAIAMAGVFTAVCILFPKQIMGLYTQDENTMMAAASYLTILAGIFFPIAGATLLSTLFRCMEKASFPLYASIIASILNTGLNYILIFGKFGIAPMGAEGAAIATVISQVVNFLIMLLLLRKHKACIDKSSYKKQENGSFNWMQYAGMLLPILICEFMWSLGENVYAAIYGHLGTEACAAMTLINPIQGLMIGALCGLSQAASVIVGKLLGNGEYEEAYVAAKKIILYGLGGACILSIVIFITKSYYVEFYQVEESVKLLTEQILIAYAIIAPCKVLNMIVGGGIIRSGGKTKYVMVIDMIGTWIFGVPLGLFSAFACGLSIPYVYFILSLEECIRLGSSIVVFRRKNWMQSLQ
ncbi:MAG: MATE family efflux transporter [Lachnospiraceae bacterium]|nr:MATE family efflux transporter [Lachnospiraceae bacterium]